MASLGRIDHVEAGLRDLPEKLRAQAPRVAAYYGVYLRQLNTIEDIAQKVLDALVNWQTSGAQLDWVLDLIGVWLGQPRPEGYDNTAYTFILQARVFSRRSTATRNDVYLLVEWLARGLPFAIFDLPPKIIIVQFTDLVLTPQDKAIYAQIITAAIDAVDALEVIYTTSSTAGYDIGLYDQELYAP